MRRLSNAAAIAIASFLVGPEPALAQSAPAPLPPNSNIIIDYVEPADPSRLDFDLDDPKLSQSDKDKLRKVQANYEALKGVRERLMKNRFLERYSLFLTALRLPTTLRLTTKQCDRQNAFYNRAETSITLCYEYVLGFEAQAPKQTTPEGITREDAIIGSIISTMLHETGHALFSIYRVPILGREEDAADQIAGYVMLQFGTDVARTTIKGAAWKWASRDWSDPAYHDVHSTPQQRFYNYLCMAYGGDPRAFQQFVDVGWLPKWRVPNCANEYRQAALAFEKTIGPHLDQALTKRVQETTWLQTETMGATNARALVGQPPSKRDGDQ
jgi:hypothetical protein